MISLVAVAAGCLLVGGIVGGWLAAGFRNSVNESLSDLSLENTYLREDIKDMSRHWSQAEIDLIHARQALRDIVALKTPNMAHIGTRMTVIAEKALKDA